MYNIAILKTDIFICFVSIVVVLQHVPCADVRVSRPSAKTITIFLLFLTCARGDVGDAAHHKKQQTADCAVYISSSTIIINEWNGMFAFFFCCCYILLSCCCWISIIDELMCIYSLPIGENSLAQRTETPLCRYNIPPIFRSRR